MKPLIIIASFLQALLAGDYNAKTLSVAEQDSILNVQSDKAQSAKEDPSVSTRYRLECEEEETIFRHSRVAYYYVTDTLHHTRKQLGAGMGFGKVRDAVMSPNGRYIAFAKNNNLYIHKLDFGTEVAVTKDEDTDIINGLADWLYEEEFGTTALFAWSPDSKQLAFVRLDEHEVPTFSWDIYADTQYPAQESLRYPKAGCPNAKASVCVYDVATKGIVTISGLKDEHNNDVYFPRIRWTERGELIVLRVNRDQTRMEVFSCNAKSTVSHLLYKEESKQYFVDYSLFDEWQWLSDGRFIVLSEKEGWRRVYLHDAQGMEQKTLTPEGIDVTALYAVNEKNQSLYYQAATTPSTRDIYAVNLKKGTIAKITDGDGMYTARFAADANSAIICHQSFTTPNEYMLYAKNKFTLILDNRDIREAWAENGLPEPELMKIPNGKGKELEAMLMTTPCVSFFTISRAAIWVQKKVPFQSVKVIFSHCFSVISRSG